MFKVADVAITLTVADAPHRIEIPVFVLMSHDPTLNPLFHLNFGVFPSHQIAHVLVSPCRKFELISRETLP